MKSGIEAAKVITSNMEGYTKSLDEEIKKHKYGLLDSMEETEIDIKDIPVLPYEDKQKMTDFINAGKPNPNIHFFYNIWSSYILAKFCCSGSFQ